MVITSDNSNPDLHDYPLSVAFLHLCSISYHNAERTPHREP
nr:MAG TPA: hypothetical protein [Caudoviricetes sp.]